MMDSAGAKVGKVSDIYIDNDTGVPEWALVHTGSFGGRESFVPLAQAQARGTEVHVPYSKDQVKGAPNAEPDGELSQQEEAGLYAHYGLDYSDGPSGSGLPTGGGGGPAPAAAPRHGERPTEDTMTRSEEQLRVGVVKRPSQTVRLRKRVVTENVTQTVPVTRERATVSREPITEANRAKAMDGLQITEAEHEVTLSEDRVVVNKETVPVERVRLDKDTVTEQETVSGEVRKEVIETEGVEETKRRR